MGSTGICTVPVQAAMRLDVIISRGSGGLLKLTCSATGHPERVTAMLVWKDRGLVVGGARREGPSLSIGQEMLVNVYG